MNIRNILCPIDFSDHSNAAISYASSLAKESGAKLHFLHVTDDMTAYPTGFTGYATSIDELREDEDHLSKVRPTVDGVAYEHHSIVGPATETILNFIASHDVDLIVMGTHGRTGVMRLLMGSVAEAVVRRADCPVITVKQPASVPA